MLRRFPVVLTVAVFNGLGIAASIAVTAAPSLASIASTEPSTQSWPTQSELGSYQAEAFRYQRNPQRGSGRRDIIR